MAIVVAPVDVETEEKKRFAAFSDAVVRKGKRNNVTSGARKKEERSGGQGVLGANRSSAVHVKDHLIARGKKRRWRKRVERRGSGGAGERKWLVLRYRGGGEKNWRTSLPR